MPPFLMYEHNLASRDSRTPTYHDGTGECPSTGTR